MTKSYEVDFNSTIKSGLPITAIAIIYPPEPDVGILSSYAEITEIQWRTGECFTLTAYDSIPESDFERLRDEALEAEDGY